MQEDLISQIEDIYEVSAISIFPLAAIYYVILAALIITLITLIIMRIKKRNFQNSWQYEAKQELIKLKNKQEISNKEVFLFIKKIALKKFSRNEIANLHGEAWLKWLTENLSKKINWEDYKLHVQNLYQKEEIILTKEESSALLKTIEKWL